MISKNDVITIVKWFYNVATTYCLPQTNFHACLPFFHARFFRISATVFVGKQVLAPNNARLLNFD